VTALRTACFIVLASLCTTTAAQDYPSKPVRIIVGFPPGGATDLVARILQPRLAQEMKREIIVDNRPGANGVVGAELASKAPPDGYSLHLATLAALVISPAITKVPYDSARDFTPIGRLVELQNIFVAHPTLAVSSIQELVAAAKARPGSFNYATSGTGSTGHLSGELLKNMAGIDWVHIPYRGGGPASRARRARSR
jgi:tripartite-type tricarboxylate transporter receptor subunit TctC